MVIFFRVSVIILKSLFNNMKRIYLYIIYIMKRLSKMLIKFYYKRKREEAVMMSYHHGSQRSEIV